ncbi:MAG: hypothetical protein A2014_02300 [Spirochaetes bacterium GWF1_49_6]|nr:MAG: hypothetical protein A2014_02300 [Spirochaetes bacterium GWF1_49_6]
MIGLILEITYYPALRFQGQNIPLIALLYYQFGMTCAGVMQFFRAGIEEDASRRQEMIPHLPVERTVHPSKQPVRVLEFVEVRRERNLNHRRDLRGGYPVPRYVGDQYPETSFRIDMEIVKIPGHPGHRQITAFYLDTVYSRDEFRENGCVYLPGDVDLLLDENIIAFRLVDIQDHHDTQQDEVDE